MNPKSQSELRPLPFESPATDADLDVVTAQLGRPVRGVASIARRCVCGRPAVVRTRPRLPGGTPFPTTFYLTLPAAVAAASTLESSGVMKQWSERLAQDAELAARYRGAHEDYLARREELGRVEEIADISAGGMPTRVKCLHVLVGHALASGSGVNPLGDEALDSMSRQWSIERCRCTEGTAADTANAATAAGTIGTADMDMGIDKSAQSKENLK